MKRCLVLLAVMAMMALTVTANDAESAEEVPGVYKNERGMHMIREAEYHW